MYLYQGTVSARSVYMSAPDLAQQIETILAEREKVSTVRVVEWSTTSRWVRDNAKPVTFLLRKYGRYQGSEMYTDFQIHIFDDVSLDPPWTFYEEMEPLTVHYDGGISLHGLALGHSEMQLSLGQLLDLGQVRSMWGVFRWQTVPEQPIA